MILLIRKLLQKKRQELVARDVFREFTNAYGICWFHFLRACLRLDDNVRSEVRHIVSYAVTCFSYT